MLQPHDAVPECETKDQNGNAFTLASLAGKRVVVFFYPNADTPG